MRAIESITLGDMRRVNMKLRCVTIVSLVQHLYVKRKTTKNHNMHQMTFMKSKLSTKFSITRYGGWDWCEIFWRVYKYTDQLAMYDFDDSNAVQAIQDKLITFNEEGSGWVLNNVVNISTSIAGSEPTIFNTVAPHLSVSMVSPLQGCPYMVNITQEQPSIEKCRWLSSNRVQLHHSCEANKYRISKPFFLFSLV